MADLPDNGTEIFDLLVVGGGVNGAGIACDAAGRGLSVLLAEKGDLAGATSSASSKLIHGGLRYLEYYEFGLVRKALMEREILLTKAPHIIRPLRIVIPHINQVRPAWMVRAGLFLYDHLAAHPRLPNSRGISLATDPDGVPLTSRGKGFAYYDAQVDDARLVVLNAMAAAGHGAEILTRTRLVAASRDSGIEGDQWRAELATPDGGSRFIRARALINAAGPWVTALITGQLGLEQTQTLRLVKGSHIVVPRLYDGDQAYLLQNGDRRVVFVMPWLEEFTLIGTTEEPYQGNPDDAGISLAELDYLLGVLADFFAVPPTRNDVVATFSGVRPLVEDGSGDMSSVTRDYRLMLERDENDRGAPLLSVFGGKITTYRRLAENAMKRLAPFFPGMGPDWTAAAPLPGGDIPGGDVADYLASLAARCPGIDGNYLAALVARHGTNAEQVLGGASDMADLGQNFGGGLYACEVDYLMAHEWARTAEDIITRRTRAGLFMDEGEKQALERYVEEGR